MRKLVYLSLLIALVLPVPATAQEWSSEQLEVWGTIVAQWEADRAKDPTWTETSLHPSFLGWSDENPMPRNKESTKTWEKYSSPNSQVHAQELSPVGIVVVDSTAVAHYYYSTAAEDREGVGLRYPWSRVCASGIARFGDCPPFRIAGPRRRRTSGVRADSTCRAGGSRQ